MSLTSARAVRFGAAFLVLSSAPACGPTAAREALPGEQLPPPALRLGDLFAREPVTLVVEGAPPLTEVAFARGTSVATDAACPPSLGGTCLDLRRPTLMGTAIADAAGRAELTVVAPAGVAPGTALHVQAVAADGSWEAPPVSGTVQAPLPLLGAWDDGFGGYHEIDVQTWRQDFGTWNVTRVDVAARTLIAQNDPGNAFFPGLWSRFDWTRFNGTAWYCQTAYAAPDEAAALATTPADPTRPDLTGCGGFSWTPLTPAEPEVTGSWTTNFGGTVDVDADAWDEGWSSWSVSRFSNLDQVVIARNDAGNPYAPGRWSRFDWAEVGGRWFYCQTAFDAPTEWAARQTPRADDTNPALTGCGGGFPWTELL